MQAQLTPKIPEPSLWPERVLSGPVSAHLRDHVTYRRLPVSRKQANKISPILTCTATCGAIGA